MSGLRLVQEYRPRQSHYPHLLPGAFGFICAVYLLFVRLLSTAAGGCKGEQITFKGFLPSTPQDKAPCFSATEDWINNDHILLGTYILGEKKQNKTPMINLMHK